MRARYPQYAALFEFVDKWLRTAAKHQAAAPRNPAEHQCERCRLASRPAWFATGHRSGQACAERIRGRSVRLLSALEPGRACERAVFLVLLAGASSAD